MLLENDSPSEFSKKYISGLLKLLQVFDHQALARLAAKILNVTEGEGSIFVAGNGGSAATASHIVNDLVIGSRMKGKKPRVFSLSDNIPTITAIGNDFSYDEIFSRQIEAYGGPGDLFIPISASGNSKNILLAVEVANKIGIDVFSIVGFDGGALRKVSNDCFHVRSNCGDYGFVEDIHMIVDHVLVTYFQQLSRQER